MRAGIVVFGAAGLLVLLPTMAVAQTQRQVDWCNNKDSAFSPDLEIRGCTAVIKSGRWSEKDLARAYALRGLAYKHKKDYDRAIADYDESIRLDPKDAFAYYDRGNAYDDKKEYDRAISDYNEAIRLDPKISKAYYSRGTAYDGKKDYDRAIADYDQAIRLDPKYAIAYSQRGIAYSNKKNYDRAFADCSQAIGLDPSEASGYYCRARVYFLKKQYDLSIADVTESIKLEASVVQLAYFYATRGRIHAYQKDYDRSIADYDQAIRLNPNDASVWSVRCKNRAIVGQLQQAIKDCNESLRLRPNNAYVLDSRGLAYLKSGNLDKAIADYDAALKLDPKLASSLYGRGVAKLKTRDTAGGNADIAAAKEMQADIETEYSGYGITLDREVGDGRVAVPSQAALSAPSAVQAKTRAILYENPDGLNNHQYIGSVVWSTQEARTYGSSATEDVVRADITIPEHNLTVMWSLRRNVDKSPPASHTVEVIFTLPSDFPHGGVQNVPAVQTSEAEQTIGMPLAATGVKVTNGYFLFGLSADYPETQANLAALKERSWFELPIVWSDHKRAVLIFEKGTAGQRDIEQALSNWQAATQHN
jgi:tetratricopeptide (TPR) repeat protein